MNVLLSIKPKYVTEIDSGKKRFEFRKKIFKEFDDQKVYIYSSSPVKKVIGFFCYSRILRDTPEKLWQKCKKSAGIPERDFFSYFSEKEIGFAIEISKFKKFSEDHSLKLKDLIHITKPPQSFVYVSDELQALLGA